MSLEAAIRAELLAWPDITAIIGDRVYLGSMPPEFPLPAITAMVISERALQVTQGLTDVREASYRLDIWAEEYRTVRELMEWCRRALVMRVIVREGVRVGRIVEDYATVLEPSAPAEIWHGVLELSTPYRIIEV